MKLALFGANGPTGRLLTQMALDEDHAVVAFTRHPEAFPIEYGRLEVAAGDVHDAAAVASAIDGVDAVVSTVGVPFAKSPVTVYSDGAANIMAGMLTAGIKRLVCVTSSAVGRHPEPLGGFIFEKIMQPYVVNRLGKTVYDDMRRMEAMVSDSDLAWTSPTLLHLPIGDRVGIIAMRDHRVLALVLLTIDNGLVVHVDALAGEAPRAAVSAAIGLR